MVNPVQRGRRPESDNPRASLNHEYFRDLYTAWQAKGKAVLDVVAEMYPDTFLKVVASHMPRETHAMITKVNLERVTSNELRTIITSAGSEDPAGPVIDAEVVQQVR